MESYVLPELRITPARSLVLLGGVQASNEQALAFYRRLGFKEVGGYTSADGAQNIDMRLTW